MSDRIVFEDIKNLLNVCCSIDSMIGCEQTQSAGLRKQNVMIGMNDYSIAEELSDNDQLFMQRAFSVVYLRLAEENFNLKQFASHMNVSEVVLNRKINLLTGLSPIVFVRTIKMNQAKKMLSNYAYNISEIAYKLGYKDPKYFSRCFRNDVGLIPKEYRARIQNQTDLFPASKCDEYFLKLALNKIENMISDSKLTFDQLAFELNVSKTTLYRKVKSFTGLAPCELINSVRIKHSAKLLKTRKNNITEIAFESGFNDPKYFSKCFKNEFGVSPSKYHLLLSTTA